MCLRRKRSGHVRWDCRVWRCDECRRGGHLKEDCVRAFATGTNVELDHDESLYLHMNENEAQATSTATGQTRGGLAEAPTMIDEGIFASHEERAVDTEAVAPSIAERDASTVDTAVELPRDAPAGDTRMESESTKADDQLLQPSRSTGVTNEASSKIKSVEGSTWAPSNGGAKPRAKKDAKLLR